MADGGSRVGWRWRRLWRMKTVGDDRGKWRQPWRTAAPAADGGGRGWIEAAVADGGSRVGWRRPWRMGWLTWRIEATVTGRPWRMGWLPWWVKEVEAGW